jgi:hypothetical protein
MIDRRFGVGRNHPVTSRLLGGVERAVGLLEESGWTLFTPQFGDTGAHAHGDRGRPKRGRSL